MKTRYIKIFNILIAIIGILIFELGYCNHTFVKELIINKQITPFYISLCRVIIYIAIIIITLIFNKKNNFEETIELLKTKWKKVLIILFIILTIIMALATIILKTQNVPIYITQISLGAILLITVLTSIIYCTKDYGRNLILIGLMASVFTVSTDTYHELDEKRYFMQSYNISYLNFDYSNPIVDTMFMYQVVPRDKMDKYYKIKYEYEQNTIENIPEQYRVDSEPANYNNIFFLASSLGIFVARVLNGSVADIFVLGRIFNLILYIFMIRYALKLMPFKKNILFIIASMPMMLALGASYSTDALGFATAMIFMAAIFKVYNEKSIKLDTKILATIFISFAILLAYKYMAYILLGLLIFILPLKDIVRNNKKKIIYMSIIALVLLIALYLLQLCPKAISINDSRGRRYECNRTSKKYYKKSINIFKSII